MQSYQSTPEQQPAPPASSPASSTDAVGNQQRTSDAGLDSGSDDRDYGLAGQFAALMLDALPLDLAVRTAVEYLDNPVVREWLSVLDPAFVADVIDGLAWKVLDCVWPVGTGFTLEGQVAGALVLGAEFHGGVQGLRTGEDSVSTTVDLSGAVGIDGLGSALGAELTGAFGDAILSAGVGAGIDLALSDHATITTPLDPMMLQGQAVGLTMDLVLAVLGAPAAAVTTGIVGSNQLDMIRGAFSPELWDHTVSFGVKGSASASLAGDPLSELPLDLVAMADIVPVLGDLLVVSKLLAKVEGSADLHVEAGGAGQFCLVAGIAAAADLQGLREVPDLLGWLDEGLLEALENRLHGGTAMTLRVPVAVGGPEGGDDFVRFDRDLGTLSMAIDSAVGAETDGVAMEIPLTALGPFLGLAPAGAGIDDLLAAGPTTEQTHSREVDRESEEFGIVLTIIEGLLSDHGLLASDADVRVESRVSVGGDALAPLAGQGVTPPQEMPPYDALAEVNNALARFATGEATLPAWLAPHEAALRSASALVERSVRLVGRVRVGAGGGVSVSAADVKGNAAAGVNAGILVDRPLTPEEARALCDES